MHFKHRQLYWRSSPLNVVVVALILPSRPLNVFGFRFAPLKVREKFTTQHHTPSDGGV